MVLEAVWRVTVSGGLRFREIVKKTIGFISKSGDFGGVTVSRNHNPGYVFVFYFSFFDQK